MSLMDRLEARRRVETGEARTALQPNTLDNYQALAAELAARVARLPVHRGRSDRARLVHQLTEIDRRVHAMLDSL